MSTLIAISSNLQVNTNVLEAAKQHSPSEYEVVSRIIAFKKKVASLRDSYKQIFFKEPPKLDCPCEILKDLEEFLHINLAEVNEVHGRIFFQRCEMFPEDRERSLELCKTLERLLEPMMNQYVETLDQEIQQLFLEVRKLNPSFDHLKANIESVMDRASCPISDSFGGGSISDEKLFDSLHETFIGDSGTAEDGFAFFKSSSQPTDYFLTESVGNIAVAQQDADISVMDDEDASLPPAVPPQPIAVAPGPAGRNSRTLKAVQKQSPGRSARDSMSLKNARMALDKSGRVKEAQHFVREMHRRLPRPVRSEKVQPWPWRQYLRLADQWGCSVPNIPGLHLWMREHSGKLLKSQEKKLQRSRADTCV